MTVPILADQYCMPAAGASPITVDYNVTPRELREARGTLSVPAWPVGRPLKTSGHARGLLGCALFIGCAVGLYLLQRREAAEFTAAAPAFIVRHPTVSVVCGGMALMFVAQVLQIWRLRNQQLSAYRSRVAFDAAGITEDTEILHTHYPWSSFSAWVETDRLIVVRIRGPVPGGPSALYFPKRLFDSEQTVARLKTLLAEHVRGPIG